MLQNDHSHSHHSPTVRILRRAALIARNGVGFWLEHNAFLHAGALAFFTLFSLAPILIVAVTVIGVVLGEDAAQGRIVEQLQDVMGTEAAVFVEQAILASRIDEAGLMPTLIGAGALLIGATTVFGQLRYSLNLLLGARTKPRRGTLAPLKGFAKSRILALLVVLLIGVCFLLYFVADASLQLVLATVRLEGSELLVEAKMDALSWAAGTLTAVLIGTLFIAMLFKLLPDVSVSWRAVLPGALVTAILLMIGRYGIAAFLANTAMTSAYGAAASLLVVLMWVYFSALLLLLGAALTRAHQETRC